VTVPDAPSDSPPRSGSPHAHDQPQGDIVLICNPRAGGRWRELAAILDSEEGQRARRIVTDSVEDIAPAIAEISQETKLLCIYGGDGTIQRVLDHLSSARHGAVQLAFLGGGTMNVTARWCGFGRSPSENFREIVRNYESGNLLFKQLNLLQVRQRARRYRGFTFGMGPLVRLLDAYEGGSKGKLAALSTASRGIAAALTGFPSSHAKLLAQMQARVVVDGEEVPHRRFSAVFANVTGQINPGVAPFVDRPTRDTFHYIAYAVTSREFTMNVGGLVRGWLPVDPRSLVRPDRIVKHLLDRRSVKGSVPTDPRYINANGSRMTVESDEELFTVDGEILRSTGDPFEVSLGLEVRVAVSSRANLRRASAMAAKSLIPRR
jgi:diacylglycerol kinase family enzyme